VPLVSLVHVPSLGWPASSRRNAGIAVPLVSPSRAWDCPSPAIASAKDPSLLVKEGGESHPLFSQQREYENANKSKSTTVKATNNKSTGKASDKVRANNSKTSGSKISV